MIGAAMVDNTLLQLPWEGTNLFEVVDTFHLGKLGP